MTEFIPKKKLPTGFMRLDQFEEVIIAIYLFCMMDMYEVYLTRYVIETEVTFENASAHADQVIQGGKK